MQAPTFGKEVYVQPVAWPGNLRLVVLSLYLLMYIETVIDLLGN